MRVQVDAPRGALVHVYRDGQLVTSVTPDEAKSLTIPANGANPDDVQIVVITRAGDVMSTPVPPSDDTSPGAVPSAGSSATGAPRVSSPNTTAPRRAAGGNRASNNRPNNKQTVTSNPQTGNSSNGKAGQRSTSDTVKPSKPSRSS